MKPLNPLKNSYDLLVVDDDSANLQLLVGLLRDQGYNVRAALDGELALQSVAQQPPDLILLDIRMPGMDGFEVCAELKRRSENREIPIIFISVLENPRDKVRAFEAGGVDYITKPFQETEVLARVRTHMDLARTRRSLEEERYRLEDRVRERTMQLANSEERFRSLVEQTADWIWEVDRNGIYTYASPQVERILGYKPEDVIGKTPFDFMSPKEKNKILPAFKELVKEALPIITLENEALHKDGQKIVLETSGSPFFDETGKVAGYRGVDRDITERKKTEKEKEQLVTNLQQAQKMEAIGTLAGGIAHDFNNILSAIMGFSGLAKRDLPEDSSAAEYIDLVLKSSKRAADLVQQILTFSRKSEHHLQPLNPHLIITEVLRMLYSSLPSTIIIHKDIDTGCGKIMADPTNIHQIIMNLSTNALHAMEKEKGTLTVKLYRKEVATEEIVHESGVSAGPFVVLSVSDTGHGMDTVTKKRIFDPFFTTKEVGKGTGMGLAVIHGIIQDYKGFIRVDSTPDEGSTFSVYIPLLQEEPISSEKTSFKEPEDEIPLSSGKKKILVVDDEPLLIKAYEMQLTDLGYRVTVTTDSKNGFEIFRTHPEDFDLLITDQTMPGLSGVELAAEVHKIKPEMPIVLCTGHSDVVSRDDALAMGIKKYVSKPIYKNELLHAIREVLDEK